MAAAVAAAAAVAEAAEVAAEVVAEAEVEVEVEVAEVGRGGDGREGVELALAPDIVVGGRAAALRVRGVEGSGVKSRRRRRDVPP